MSTSTQSINNTAKALTSKAAGKSKIEDKQNELQFEALFSSALGQMTPKVELNSTEPQKRESQAKQGNKENKNASSDTAQAAMWAQRNWIQQTSAPTPAAPSEKPIESAKADTHKTPGESQASQQAEPAKDKLENTESDTATEKTASPEAGKKTAVEKQAAEASAKTENEHIALALSGQSTTVQQGNSTPAEAGSAQPTVQHGAPDKVDQKTTEPKTGTETAQSTDTPIEFAQSDDQGKTAVDTSRLQDKSTGNTKVDTLLNNSTTSTKVDTPTTGNQAANFSNASAVAAQLAPQIAKQLQNTDEQLSVNSAKTSPTITAGTVLAAGTNGLNGTLSTGQPALIKTPVTQPGFAKELSQTVNWAIGKNMSTVDIRVNPESFGPMNMRLIQKGQQVQLVIRTQDEASANLLTQALSGLKEVMAQNGLQLNQVQIQHGNTPAPNGQAGSGQQNFDQQQEGQGRHGQQSAHGGNAQQEQSQPVAGTPASKTEGKLDLFA